MPYSTRFGDHFYSRADGRAESRHVFLNGNRLFDRLPEASRFTVGELGFGTGLNFVETWRLWKASRRPTGCLRFISFELFPLTAAEMRRALSAWPEIREETRALTEAWPEEPAGSVVLRVDGQTSLEVRIGEAAAGVTAMTGEADAWFLDGFAPARNPGMWTPELLGRIFRRTVAGGSFATYTAAGHVRRALIAAGFRVERRPGHGDKREMLAGFRRGDA